MKAYRTAEDDVVLFRPDENMKRMSRSSERLALPTFDINEGVECLKALLRVESDWAPNKKGYSLYIRPTMISTAVLWFVFC